MPRVEDVKIEWEPSIQTYHSIRNLEDKLAKAKSNIPLFTDEQMAKLKRMIHEGMMCKAYNKI